MPYQTGETEIDYDEAESLLSEGMSQLSEAMLDSPLDGYQVDVLIYEYKWNEARTAAEPLAPGRLTSDVHLRNSCKAGDAWKSGQVCSNGQCCLAEPLILD
jgi:hypothetical protein